MPTSTNIARVGVSLRALCTAVGELEKGARGLLVNSTFDECLTNTLHATPPGLCFLNQENCRFQSFPRKNDPVARRFCEEVWFELAVGLMINCHSLNFSR